MPKKQINVLDDCNFILTSLYNNMEMLKFGKGFIKAQNMTGFIEDGKVKFSVDYDFYVFKKEETDKMQKLYI